MSTKITEPILKQPETSEEPASKPKRRGRPTIVDVAKKAGVSFKTVSRVLNSEQSVTEATRKKVLAAANDLDYRINLSARALRSGRSTFIGLFFHNASRAYVGDIQAGAVRECRRSGYHLIVEDQITSIDSVASLLRQTELAGVVLTPPLSDNIPLMDFLIEKGVPFVRIEADSQCPSADQDFRVSIDNEEAAFKLTSYLIEQGHERIGFISGNPGYSVSKLRLMGYKKALAAHDINLDETLILSGDFSYDSAVAPAKALLTLPDRPTAIFAANDDMAAAVLGVAAQQNIQVPDQLSVAGFDNTQTASVVYPKLTTVLQPIIPMAQKAVELLISREQQTPPEAVVLPYEIIKRDSVARRSR